MSGTIGSTGLRNLLNTHAKLMVRLDFCDENLDFTNNEEHVLEQANWLFSLDQAVALECFKKVRGNNII